MAADPAEVRSRYVRSVAVVGYARVSTRDQHPEAQTDALAAAGCDKRFTEHASGTLARRPALDEALSYLRAGDTLVVTKLDRLGRSVRNLKQIADDLQARQVGLRAVSQGIDTTTPGGRLFFHMLAAIAEFEHDLIVERTHDGLAAARARGRKGGPRANTVQLGLHGCSLAVCLVLGGRSRSRIVACRTWCRLAC